MSIQQAALVAAVGLCLTFGVRTAGTAAPDLFASPAAALAGIALQLIGGLTLLIFLVVFLRGQATRRPALLRRVTWIAVLGAIAGLLPELQGLSRVTGVLATSDPIHSNWCSLLAPWLAGLTLLLFFFVLWQRARSERLWRGITGLGLTGAGAFFLVNTLTALQFVAVTAATHNPTVPRILLLAAAPAAVLGFLCLLSFFVVLSRRH